MTNPTKKEKLAGQEQNLKKFIQSDIGKVCQANLAKHDFDLLLNFINSLLASQAQKVREELLEQVETASWIQYPPDKTKFVSLAEIKKIIYEDN